MKTRSAAFILTLCCAFAAAISCGKQEGASLKSEGNLIFNISVGAGTKTSGTIDDTASEAAISSLRIFMIDADSEGAAASTWNCTELTDFSYSSTTGKATSTFRYTMAGDYLFFAIANWPSSLTLDTSSYAALTASCYDASSCLSELWDENSFLMTQNEGPVYKHISNLACDSSNPIEVDIKLDRVAAKVSVHTAPNSAAPLVGTLLGGHDAVYAISKVNVQEVALINCVNQFNILQTKESGVLVTPSSDPEYSLSTGYYNTSLASLDWQPMGTVMYCLENNSPYYADVAGDDAHPDAADSTKMKSRVTGLLFKVEVKTLSSFKNEADTDIENENLRVDPEEGLWKTKADDTSDEAARTLYLYKGILFADWQQLSAQNPDIAAEFGEGEAPDADELRELGVSVYEDGLMYYTYWLNDNGALQVSRNTYYNILLKEIVSFGDDVPLGRDYSATDPINLKPGIISITLSIADWDIKAEQDYTL